MNPDIINQIVSYIKTYNSTSNILVSSVNETNKHTLVNFKYLTYSVTVTVYNPIFLSIKVNSEPFAFCDSIHTFRKEMDRMCMKYYYA